MATKKSGRGQRVDVKKFVAALKEAEDPELEMEAIRALANIVKLTTDPTVRAEACMALEELCGGGSDPDPSLHK